MTRITSTTATRSPGRAKAQPGERAAVGDGPGLRERNPGYSRDA
jgi:hypothetical protein